MDLKNLSNLSKQLDQIIDYGKAPNQNLETLEVQLTGLVQTSSQTMNIEKSEIKTIEDKDFIDSMYRKQIEIAMRVLEIAGEMRIGAPAQNQFAFAQINESVTNALEKFVQYKKMIHGIDLVSNPDFIQPQNTQINIFDSKTILDRIKAAKTEAEIDKIEPVFHIETQLESLDRLKAAREKKDLGKEAEKDSDNNSEKE